MKIAAVQMVSTPSVETNLAAAHRLVGSAAAAGAGLVVLPEYFCFMGKSDRDKLAVAERPGEGPIQRALAEMARESGIWLIGGTLPLAVDAAVDAAAAAADGGRVMNANLVFSPRGEVAARYDKMHLFAFDNGRERYDEARTLRAGRTPVAFDADGWRVGLSVCYDLRFPELYRALARPPCDLVSVPSAFTYTTGLAHWEVLLRARAIENQCYVVAAAQGGTHENGRRTFGHSLVVDPWGEVVACRRDDGEGIVVAELSRERIADVRRQLPALEHRLAL
jgi:nitrilase